MATKAKKSAPKSKRGGSRAGAGRKPKAITEMREALIAPMVVCGNQTTDVLPLVATVDLADHRQRQKNAAEYALALFEDTMRDPNKGLDLRLDCAKEVLNRTIGKPRIAEPPKPDEELEERVHIYLPDNGRDQITGAC